MRQFKLSIITVVFNTMLLIDSVLLVSILLASFSIHMSHWYYPLEGEISDILYKDKL
jgi:hypothetical protein